MKSDELVSAKLREFNTQIMAAAEQVVAHTAHLVTAMIHGFAYFSSSHVADHV